MNRFLLFTALAYAARRFLNQHVAVVVKGWRVLGVGVDTRTAADGAGAAVATALQNLANTERLDECDIFATYPPTELCLGMARICRIRAIFVVRGGQIVRFRPQEAVGDGGFVVDNISAPELKVAKINPKGGAPPMGRTIPNVATSVSPEADAGAWWQQATVHAKDWYEGPAAQAVSAFDNAPSFALVTPPDLPLVPTPLGPTMPRKQTLRDTIYMLTAYAIAAVTWNRIDDWKGNKVACILVNPFDHIVSWGINMREGENVTWHGETVTLRRLLKVKGIATMGPGYRLYTTLKPCYMCAGMVAQVAPSMTIIYGQNDPEITHSCLDRDAAHYPQCASLASHTPSESFPALLQRLLQAAGGNAIPFLENMSLADRGTSFEKALSWFKTIRMTVSKQYHEADKIDRVVNKGRLAYLDLAVPDKREISANLFVLHQALSLMQTIGAKVGRMDI